MATYDTRETTKGNDSGTELSDKGLKSYTATRSWTIVSDTLGQSAVEVRRDLQSLGDLPTEGETHPDNLILGCKGVNVVRAAPFYFTATAKYKSPPVQGGGGGDDEDSNPWDIPALVSWRSATSELNADQDFDGVLIANPGTNEPVTGITRRVTDVIAVIKRPFLVFSGPVILGFADQINSDAYLGFPAGRGQVQSITADPQIHNETTYYDVSAEINFRTNFQVTADKTWHHRRKLEGFYEKITNVDLPIRIKDGEDKDITVPALLDLDGKKLADGATPEWKETKLYGSVAFADMGFFS